MSTVSEKCEKRVPRTCRSRRSSSSRCPVAFSLGIRIRGAPAPSPRTASAPCQTNGFARNSRFFGFGCLRNATSTENWLISRGGIRDCAKPSKGLLVISPLRHLSHRSAGQRSQRRQTSHMSASKRLSLFRLNCFQSHP